MKLRSQCINPENEATQTVHVPVSSVKDASTQTEPDSNPSPASQSPRRPNPLPVYMMAAPAVLMPTFGYYLQGFPAPFAPGQLVLLPVSQPAPGRNN
ncbi:hypothetical protein quinque_011551 [Culex quinquefasciatus]